MFPFVAVADAGDRINALYYALSALSLKAFWIRDHP